MQFLYLSKTTDGVQLLVPISSIMTLAVGDDKQTMVYFRDGNSLQIDEDFNTLLDELTRSGLVFGSDV